MEVIIVGTNYYFENIKSKAETDVHNNKVKAIAEEYKSKLLELDYNKEDVEWLYFETLWKLEREPTTIHIGKCSAGWIPLFQSQVEYDSISSMKKWYEDNKTEWQVVNEYGKHLTWEQLEDELINWNRNNDKAQSHLKFDGEYGHYYMKDGVEWTDGEFS